MSNTDFQSRARQLFDTVFGEDRVQLVSRLDEDPPQLDVEDGTLWVSPPTEDCDEYTWGSATYIPGTYECPPDCDVVDLGQSKRMDDALKAVILLHAERLLNDRFDHEADEAEARAWEEAEEARLDVRDDR